MKRKPLGEKEMVQIQIILYFLIQREKQKKIQYAIKKLFDNKTVIITSWK